MARVIVDECHHISALKTIADMTIADIEWLEHIFALPDTRRLRSAEREAANERHDKMYAANPWFRLWKRYGICTQPDSSRPYPPPQIPQFPVTASKKPSTCWPRRHWDAKAAG
jgi:hypothetical protein